MRTREEVFAAKARPVLQLITTYKAMLFEQMMILSGLQPDDLKGILTTLERQRRIWRQQGEDSILFASQKDAESPYQATVACLWVLCDFADKVNFHTPVDFPANIVFITEDDEYEISYITTGQEQIVNTAFRLNNPEYPPKRIVVVETIEQAAILRIPHTAGFCTVGNDGKVGYYQYKESADEHE